MEKIRATDLAAVRRLTASGEAQQILDAAQVSKSEAARTVDVSPAAISRWNAGQRRPCGAAAVRYGKLLEQLRRMAGSQP